MASVHVPLDDVEDRRFWDAWDEAPTPLYYAAFVAQKPERCSAALRAIAHAAPGGVVFHCGGGRDRTGLVALLVLALAGAEHDAIVHDYELSYERMRRYYSARREPDQGPELRRLLAGAGTSARSVLLDLLATLDVETLVSDEEAAAIRRRLRPASPPSSP